MALAGVSSLALTGVVRAHAIRRGLLDTPNARSSHSAPTPRGGGLAVLVAWAVAVAIGVWLDTIHLRDAATLGVGMLMVGLVGWIDDTRGVRATIRLTVHLAAAAWTLYMFRGLPVVSVGVRVLEVGAVGYLLGAIGIVWSINLFNFMDGIDGLAGSQAVIVFGTAALLLYSRGNASLGAIGAAFSAASLGFLVWNWPPAKIFMGDVGSGASGYLIAGLALASENSGSVPVLVFAIIGGVFITDATVTVLRRLARGERVSEAHRSHAYQRLARAWNSHLRVSVAAALTTLLLAALGTVVTVAPRLLVPASIAACVLLGGLLVAAERRAPS